MRGTIMPAGDGPIADVDSNREIMWQWH